MLELLQEVARQARQDNPFLGQGQLAKLQADLAALPPEPAELPRRWLIHVELGENELRLGHVDQAVEHYQQAYRLLTQSRDPVPVEHFLRTVFELGVAYMRVAETQNCVARHTSDSCILPIRDGGVHMNKEGATNAVKWFSEVLKVAKPDSLEHIRARWLLNIASMTLGLYPDGVPPMVLIPPQAFAADEPFPRFEDIASRVDLDGFNLAGSAIAEDFNGDGFLDIMTSSSDVSGQLRLHVNQGDGSFSERTEAAGLVGLYGGLNIVHADYNKDGHPDVLVLRGAWWRQHGRHPRSLLRNNGNGTFTDVTFEAGLGQVYYPTQTAAWADYDNDGDLDLYIGNESGKAIRFDQDRDDPLRAPCQLFRNNGDGTFIDVAAQAGVENLLFTKGVSWGDYNNDRFPDLYASNGGQPNRLYRNNKDGTFTDVAAESAVTEPLSSFGTWFWDVNNDGALDLWVAAYGSPRTPPDVASVAASYLGLPALGELARLYLGDGHGGFKDVSRSWGLTRVTLPMGSNFGDLDNDGFPDFYLGTGYPFYAGLVPNIMYHNRRGQGFADVTTAGGFGHLQKGHGVVFADLDHDGDQDVFEEMGGAYPGDAYRNVLFENPGFGNHWLKLSLIGKRSNRAAIGARVRADIVEDGQRRSVYSWVNSGGSFGSNPLRREMGLGQATRIELLEVYWPTSDTTQRFEGVAADQWIEVTEGQEGYRARAYRSFTFGS